MIKLLNDLFDVIAVKKYHVPPFLKKIAFFTNKFWYT